MDETQEQIMTLTGGRSVKGSGDVSSVESVLGQPGRGFGQTQNINPQKPIDITNQFQNLALQAKEALASKRGQTKMSVESEFGSLGVDNPMRELYSLLGAEAISPFKKAQPTIVTPSSQNNTAPTQDGTQGNLDLIGGTVARQNGMTMQKTYMGGSGETPHYQRNGTFVELPSGVDVNDDEAVIKAIADNNAILDAIEGVDQVEE